MTRHRFYVGTTDKDNNDVPAEVWTRIGLELAAEFGGFTRYDATGAWRDPQGQLIQEPCHVYEVLTEQAQTFVGPWIRTIANQSAVLYTREPVHGEFV